MQSFDIVMYGRRWRVAAVGVAVASKDDGDSSCAVAARAARAARAWTGAWTGVRGVEGEGAAEREGVATTVFFLK